MKRRYLVPVLWYRYTHLGEKMCGTLIIFRRGFFPQRVESEEPLFARLYTYTRIITAKLRWSAGLVSFLEIHSTASACAGGARLYP